MQHNFGIGVMSIPRVNPPQYIQKTPQGYGLYQAPDGQIALKEQAESIWANELRLQSNKRTEDVLAHERAHQLMAGGFGGGVVMEYGSDAAGNPFATTGHVNVQLANQNINFKSTLPQLEKNEEHARTVAASAIAPQALGGEAGKLSTQDWSVYAQSMATLARTRDAKSKRLTFEGQIYSKTGQQPDKNQELNAEMISQSRRPFNITV